jgi:hypothetical protein
MAQEKRKARRQAVTQGAVICDGKGHLIGGCSLSDVSKTGGRLKLAPGIGDLPSRFVLVLSRGGAVRRQCHAVWRDGDALGVRFVVPS